MRQSRGGLSWDLSLEISLHLHSLGPRHGRAWPAERLSPHHRQPPLGKQGPSWILHQLLSLASPDAAGPDFPKSQLTPPRGRATSDIWALAHRPLRWETRRGHWLGAGNRGESRRHHRAQPPAGRAGAGREARAWAPPSLLTAAFW